MNNIKKFDTYAKLGKYYRVIEVDKDTVTLKETAFIDGLCLQPVEAFEVGKEELTKGKYRKLNAASINTYTLTEKELEKYRR